MKIETQLADAIAPTRPDVVGKELFINHSLWNRDGNRIYIHGATKTRVVRRTPGLPMCLTVTHLDGLVVARSGFNHSVNYRSCVVHGVARDGSKSFPVIAW